ncbi:MAG: response regulator [Methylotenera sp.]|nr:response regulator [Methylotenera sp.]
MSHVLIIEDEPAIAETLIYAFQEMGMQATHKSLGGDALNELNQHAYDFVLLDVGLPDMPGFDVCKKIRETSKIPLLFLTARNHEIDRIVGLEIIADDHVAKPFSPREVVTRVKAILRRTEHRIDVAKPAKSTSNFVLDALANRIQYHDRFLDLTRYEFLLLKTLPSIAHCECP